MFGVLVVRPYPTHIHWSTSFIAKLEAFPSKLHFVAMLSHSLERLQWHPSRSALMHIGSLEGSMLWGGPKAGEALHLSIESSILGEPPYLFLFFCNGPIKLAHFKKKRKEVRLVTHPQLINMKQNTYPHYKLGVLVERCMQTSWLSKFILFLS